MLKKKINLKKTLRKRLSDIQINPFNYQVWQVDHGCTWSLTAEQNWSARRRAKPTAWRTTFCFQLFSLAANFLDKDA
jgi:hypothetical protein